MKHIITLLIPAIFIAAFGLNAAGLPIFNTEQATNGPAPARDVATRSVMPTGFELTAFAAEPEVQQPIAMATDSRGRLWVGENYTYSEASVGYHAGLRDRILVFEDADNDGHFDKRTVFWDQAERLTSVEVGLGGVWALCLPQLLFIPDANGDGIPDGPPQVVLDGFEYQRGRHTVANGLRWGPDGWLYGRHGIQSTSLLGAPGTPEARRVAMNVGVWRYHPTRKVVEVVASGTTNPWGMDWTPEGELFFINTVIGHLWHVIPGAHYRRMYGDDPTPNIYRVIEQHADHVHWAEGEVWTDVRKGVTDVTSAAGGGHAHTGLLVYQGGQWPEKWRGRLLTLNYHGKRLNVERLESEGTGIVGRREPDMVFFADPWFRGIDLIAAPDGGVFISDWSDAGECHDQEGIHRTSGRIYKLRYGQASAPVKDVSKASERELVELQTSDNDWLARQSRRVLAERSACGQGLQAARAQLASLVDSASAAPLSRLRAMWALHVMGGLSKANIEAALLRSPAERCWALRLLEDRSHQGEKEAHEFADFSATRAPGLAREETAAPVRLVLASLLPRFERTVRIEVARALLAHAEDSADHNQPQMLWYGIEPLATSGADFVNLVVESRIPLIQSLGGRRAAQDAAVNPALLNRLFAALSNSSSESLRSAVLDGIHEGLAGQRRVPSPSGWSEFKGRIEPGASGAVRARLLRLGAMFGDEASLSRLAERAGDESLGLADRRTALETLVQTRAPTLRPVCERLLRVPGLAIAAAAGLSTFDDPVIGGLLVDGWREFDPETRTAVMNVLLSRVPWTERALSALASGVITRAEFGVVQARQVLARKSPALKQRLEEVWGTVADVDSMTRNESLRQWREALSSERLKRADAGRGVKVYEATCAPCHKLYGRGGALGPDLTGSGRQNLEYLLENILFPNAVVAADYRQTNLEMKDGRVLSGLVRGRNPASFTLEMVGGAQVIARSDVAREETSALSLMPEGLLASLDPAAVADLFAYLMSAAPPAKK